MIFKKLLIASCAIMFALASCETNDVTGPPAQNGPEVKLTLSQQVISENGGNTEIIATLLASSTADVVVTLKFAGTAVQGVNYNVSSQQITIAAGAIIGKATLAAIDDTAKAGNNSVVISIDNVQGGFTDGLQQQTLIIEDDDVPPVVSLLINEVLYDPSNSGLDGDANGDGVYAQAQDEFIEFINMSSQPLDLTGYEIYDAESLTAGTPNHVFPAGSIVAPGKAIVVFGGGTPTGTFGGATVQTSTSGDLNMNNAGDFVTILNPTGDVIVTFDITPLSDNPNESYTRNPDLTGAFEQHSTNTPILFSPGTKIDGSAF
jgi:hypothetical protein